MRGVLPMMPDPFAPTVATVRRFCRTCQVGDLVDVPSQDDAKHSVSAWMRVHGDHRDSGYQVVGRENVEEWKPTAAYIRWCLRHWNCCLGWQPPRRPGTCNGERFAGPDPAANGRKQGGGPAAWTIWLDLRADLTMQMGLLSERDRSLCMVVADEEPYSHAANRLGCRVPDIKLGVAGVVEALAKRMRGGR